MKTSERLAGAALDVVAGRRGVELAEEDRGGRAIHPLYDTPDVVGPDLISVTDQVLELDS